MRQSINEMRNVARQEGDATMQALDQILQVNRGERMQAGDYLIAITTEKAKGWWQNIAQAGVQWREPGDIENQHIEVFVLDAEDHRIVPCLEVNVTLIDSNGEELDTQQHEMFWHPAVYHYGANWSIPQEDDYSIVVHISSPHFPRHDKETGNRYLYSVDAVFDQMHLIPGRE